MTNVVVATPQELIQQPSTPANPPAGTLLLYPKSDGKMYTLSSAGVEVKVGSLPADILSGTFPGSYSMAGNLTLTATSAGLELGSISTPGTPYVDFHSSGNPNDYDARIIASGGGASDELGTLTLRAASVAASAALVVGTSITLTTGDILAANGRVLAKSSTAATGWAQLNPGTVANGGYLGIFGTDGVRQGYIGFGAGPGVVTDTTEIRYVSGQHLFSGPIYENAQRVYSPNNPPPASVSRTMPFFMA